MSRFLGKLHKADYQREFGDLIEAIDQATAPTDDTASLLDLDYGEEGLPSGSLKYVTGLGLFVLDLNSVAFVNGITVLATGQEPGRWLALDTGGGGGGGGNTSEEVATLAFNSPLLTVLGILAPGDVISEVRVHMAVPFNNPAATITVGTATNPSEFFGAGEVLLDSSFTFEETFLYISPVADQVQVVLNPAGSTTGTLNVYYRIRKA